MNKKVFMVMPFSNKVAKDAYDYSVKKICDKHNLEIRRADDIFSTKPIYDDIVKEIKDASIIIVDISDNNPNVYYELGMAHTLKQNQTIIITQGEYNKTPFDIAHFRIIKYENSIEGKESLERQLDLTLKTLLTDYKAINRKTYELIFSVLVAGKRQDHLATILGIRDFKGVVKSTDRLDMEYGDAEKLSTQRTSVQNNISTLHKLGYLSVDNEIVNLTEEGKAFAEIVEVNGIKCYSFNGQTFEENYISFAEKWKKQDADKENRL
ncbi:hypothetical protein H1R16_11065 [Marnyiella aurantia]|uniref:Uncharacterized protein n=1 Tax=Marnyiella aurantia TaxID=2758037 RepID=A0A7D7QXU2_9FLAO|nr:hypothetical protein [Marnyiella aurantia]MBA5246406.1 hypothetical protein [Marnyiella aurantia]QMS98226.1 hypothetical protein H1R16_11065 [Marnyiella aurantia]